MVQLQLFDEMNVNHFEYWLIQLAFPGIHQLLIVAKVMAIKFEGNKLDFRFDFNLREKICYLCYYTHCEYR